MQKIKKLINEKFSVCVNINHIDVNIIEVISMTRRKKRKLKAFIKEFILISLPFIAGIFMNIGDIMAKLADKMDSIDIQVMNEKKTYSGKISEDFEDIIISEGYGYAEESESSQTENEPEIYKIVPENAGAKPYPTEWTEGGSIVRTTYGHYDGTTFFDLDNGGQVNNKTSVDMETLKEESRLLPEFKIEDTDEPQVLIYHTHTTETYEPYVRDFFDSNFNYRTTDETKNVIMVGDAIQKELESAGIGVIHSKEIHDYPSYNGAYDRSAETVNEILEQYPTIKVVLDIHRDAICTESVAYQPYVEINGKEASQIMIISGCDDGTMDMPNYMKNFRFASLLQSQIENDNPGLTRPILFDYRHYNQDITTGSLLIEVGSHGNTLDQSYYSGELLGKSIAKALKGLK